VATLKTRDAGLDIPTYKLFIDGEWVNSQSGSFIQDINPGTGELYAYVAQAGPYEIERALASAQRAGVSWGNTVASDREAILFKAASIFASRAQEIEQVIVQESGSTAGKAKFEVEYAIALLRMAAGSVRHLTGQTMPITMPAQLSMTVRRPLGVIAGISPFNAPLLLAIKKVVPAIAAGNTFVLKPSEETPIVGLKIAEIFEQAGLPPGVLNVIPGPAQMIGDVLVSDPRVKLITYTGSTRVGRILAVEAARHQKRFVLELGGKNPLIVLADAKMDYCVRAAAFGIFFHQGQVCMANSRIIVEEPLYDEFCDRFTTLARGLKVGDPSDPETVIGPLIRESQCQFINDQIKDALMKGAQLLTGGTHSGRYYAPTVIRDVTNLMRIYDEESFGPVVSIYKASNSEHALDLANETSYGLSSAVITNDLHKALDLALRLEAGMVHINDSSVSDEIHVPFGGIKASGAGKEGGLHSMFEMTELKWITIQLGEREFPI
jgi:acyl-CoA reductase-like NAD-dependent aldehyde dehydrogenase